MNEPDVFFYLNGQEKIYGLLEKVCLKAKTRVFQSIEDLAQKLRQPKENVIIVVLLVATEEELQEMLSIRSLLMDIPLIVILPERKEEIISQGRKLYPRFLTYADGDLDEIVAVLEKMLEKLNKQQMIR